jgi:hypothetical protein
LAQKAPTPLSEIRVPPPPQKDHPMPDAEIEAIEAQIKRLQGLISQSEINLKAHHDAIENLKKVGDNLGIFSM